MSLFLGNRGTKLYKLEEENIVSKFIKRGTNNGKRVGTWEHRAILEGNKEPPWETLVILIFIAFTTHKKTIFTGQAGRSFTNGFSGPKSFRDFRETGP